MKQFYLFILLCVLKNSITADVTSWRNGSNGRYPSGNAMIDWAGTKELLWKIDTPIKSNASPILIKNRLFYCAEPAVLICADANTGKILWKESYGYEDLLSEQERQKLEKAKETLLEVENRITPLKRQQYTLSRQLSRNKDDKELAHKLRAVNEQIESLQQQIPSQLAQLEKPETKDINGYASYTPCSDGEYIYTCSGLGIVAKFSLQGERIWAKRMEWPDYPWGGASSPVLVEDKVIVRFAEYAALDIETGDELWRTTDPVAFGPPASFQLEGQWFLYTVRGELIRAKDGRKLPSQNWTIQGKDHAFFNTNAVSENRIYAVHGAGSIDGQAYCMEIPDTVERLEEFGLKMIWNTAVEENRYYASPLVHDGIVYLLARNRVMQALDATTGQLIYSQKIPGMKDECYAGLLMVGDKIYFGEESGIIVILEPGSTYQEVARFKIGECRSSPIFDGDRAYLRTLENVFAFQTR